MIKEIEETYLKNKKTIIYQKNNPLEDKPLLIKYLLAHKIIPGQNKN